MVIVPFVDEVVVYVCMPRAGFEPATDGGIHRKLAELNGEFYRKL